MFAQWEDGSEHGERGRLLLRAVARSVGRTEVHPVVAASEAVLANAASERDRVAALRLRAARQRSGRHVVAGPVALAPLLDAALEARHDLRRLAEREPDPRAVVALGAHRGRPRRHQERRRRKRHLRQRRSSGVRHHRRGRHGDRGRSRGREPGRIRDRERRRVRPRRCEGVRHVLS